VVSEEDRGGVETAPIRGQQTTAGVGRIRVIAYLHAIDGQLKEQRRVREGKKRVRRKEKRRSRKGGSNGERNYSLVRERLSPMRKSHSKDRGKSEKAKKRENNRGRWGRSPASGKATPCKVGLLKEARERGGKGLIEKKKGRGELSTARRTTARRGRGFVYQFPHAMEFSPDKQGIPCGRREKKDRISDSTTRVEMIGLSLLKSPKT